MEREGLADAAGGVVGAISERHRAVGARCVGSHLQRGKRTESSDVPPDETTGPTNGTTSGDIGGTAGIIPGKGDKPLMIITDAMYVIKGFKLSNRKAYS